MLAQVRGEGASQVHSGLCPEAHQFPRGPRFLGRGTCPSKGTTLPLSFLTTKGVFFANALPFMALKRICPLREFLKHFAECQLLHKDWVLSVHSGAWGRQLPGGTKGPTGLRDSGEEAMEGGGIRGPFTGSPGAAFCLAGFYHEKPTLDRWQDNWLPQGCAWAQAVVLWHPRDTRCLFEEWSGETSFCQEAVGGLWGSLLCKFLGLFKAFLALESRALLVHKRGKVKIETEMELETILHSSEHQ